MSLLRPCAVGLSRGRQFGGPDPAGEASFEIDRGRIIHSAAFRRLMYKTQVFVNHEGDLFRTRLTHTLEVVHLARSVARTLGLNEALAEAIALAHDLGHTPFGHAGQSALNDCMREQGGFEHNLQSLRIVDMLDCRHPGFDGLDLSFETREGILKHCSYGDALRLECLEPNGVAHRFIQGGQPSLEAQLTNLVDEVAYSAHDLDDGVRSGLLMWEDLCRLPALGPLLQEVASEYPAPRNDERRRWLSEATRRLVERWLADLHQTSATAIDDLAPTSADVARQTEGLMGYSAQVTDQVQGLKRFLHRHLYRHPDVVRTMSTAADVVRDLFAAFCDRPEEMPAAHHRRPDRERAVADYVAGMTDRFALREHQRLTGLQVHLPVSAAG